MFFVDNDEAESLERQEYSTPGPKDYIVGILGELLLPNLDTFRICIFRVIDAQTVTKDTMESIHHLNGKRNLWQEVEHLLLLVKGLLNKMDVNLGLSAGCDSVKQCDRLLKEGKLYLIEGILLRQTEGLDLFRMRFPAKVQAAHFLFVGFDNTTLDKGRDRGEGVTLIEQFIAGNTCEIVYS